VNGTARATDGETGRAHLAMLGFAFLVSTSFPVGHAITNALDPALLTAVRFLLAATIFAAIALWRGRWHWPPLSRLPVYLVIAVFLDVFFVTMFEALRLTSALNAGAVFTLLPAFTALAGLAILRQRISQLQVLCLAVGAVGALLVLFGDDLSRLLRLEFGPGERIYLVGVAAYAFYAPLMRLLNRGEALETFNFWILVVGAALLLLYARGPLVETEWTGLSWEVLAGIVYLAVFPTATSFFCATYASLRLPAGPVMAYTYLLPSFVLVETLLLGAPAPGPWSLAGVGVTTIATVLLQVRGTGRAM
jgi:drug/metabolite transporter (DMT)-like permease